MAFIRNEYCRGCAADTQHIDGKCAVCRERKQREALAAWQAKTTEEKLLDLHRRLLRLEGGPTKLT